MSERIQRVGDGEDGPESPWEGAQTSQPHFWRLVYRHRWQIALCAALAVAAAALATTRMTPVYEATASLRIDPDDSRLTDLGIDRPARPSELPTEFQVLQSRRLLELVTDSLGLQLEVRSRVPRGDVFAVVHPSRAAQRGEYEVELRDSGRVQLRPRGASAGTTSAAPGTEVELGGLSVRLSPASRLLPALRAQHGTIEVTVSSFDETARRLQKTVKVRRRTPESNILDVTYRGTDPELVRDIPNVLTTQFIAGRQRERRAQARNTAAFLREQIEKLSRRLHNSEEELRTFRERTGVVSLPDEASTGVTQLAEVRAKRNALEAERTALAALVQAVGDSLAKDPLKRADAYRNLVAFPTLLQNPAVSQLLGSLTTLEDRRSDLLTRRSLQDPDVQALSRRASGLGEEIRGLALTYLDGLTRQVAALDGELRESRQRLDRIPEKELQFARLDRETKGLEEIVTQLQSRLKEAEIAEAVQDPSIRLVDAAILPTEPASPKPLLNLSLALLGGLGVGLVGAFLLEYVDRTARSRNDVLLATGVPVMGVIPRAPRRMASMLPPSPRVERPRIAPPVTPVRTSYSLFSEPSAGPAAPAAAPSPAGTLPSDQVPAGESRRTRGPSRGKHRRSRARAALLLNQSKEWFLTREGYNRLATNLAFAWPDAVPKVLIVTSPLPGEGKTTVAVNLALTVAEHGGRVLLIDADLRRGGVAELLGLACEPGLSDVLLGSVSFRAAIQDVASGELAHLRFMGCGRAVHNPPALLGTQIESLLRSLRTEFESIIIDTPPINVIADAAAIGAHGDGVVVVARAGVTHRQALVLAVEQLRRVGARVLGAILNDVDYRRDADYDEAYEYYAHYARGSA
jgi:capsular exopolysaccharide synthesis family protein